MHDNTKKKRALKKCGGGEVSRKTAKIKKVLNTVNSFTKQERKRGSLFCCLVTATVPTGAKAGKEKDRKENSRVNASSRK